MPEKTPQQQYDDYIAEQKRRLYRGPMGRVIWEGQREDVETEGRNKFFGGATAEQYKDRQAARTKVTKPTADWGAVAGKLYGGTANAAADRTRNLGALDMLQRMAGGQGLVSEQVGQRQLESGQAAIASRLASMAGGYNPAAQRAALYATRDLAQKVAGDTELNAAKERLAAQKLYSDAALRQYLAGLQEEGGRGRLGLAALSAGSGENLSMAQILAALYGGDATRATQMQIAQMQQPSTGQQIAQGVLGVPSSLFPMIAQLLK